ncbi:MAG: hypothetical protein Fur005_31130 [Roseiflexaceae bacterium]
MSRTTNDARERVIRAAEQLFAEKGYGPVTLRQIGVAAGIHHSSLYHHVPGGKADLFIEVTERMLDRHQIGVQEALDRHAPDLRAQLYAVAEWFIHNPPIDLLRMEHVDLQELGPSQHQHLTEYAYQALQVPIIIALQVAKDRGIISYDDLDLVSGGLVGMIQSLHAVSEEAAGKPRLVMAQRLIDLLLDGLLPRR